MTRPTHPDRVKRVLEIGEDDPELTQSDIAERTGLLQQQVSRIELAAGKRRRRFKQRRRSFADAATSSAVPPVRPPRR